MWNSVIDCIYALAPKHRRLGVGEHAFQYVWMYGYLYLRLSPHHVCCIVSQPVCVCALYLCMYVPMCACTNVICLCVCFSFLENMSVCLYVCILGCVYVCMYVCMCVCGVV